jgi:dihydrofolate reductase
MKAIVAVDLNWGIGFKGNLLQRIPDDMKFFKQMTLGKVVVMGRETFESLPGKEPLKDRTNIVLSKDKKFTNKNLIICRSLDELTQELKKYNSGDIFVIGGESVYRQLLPYCTEAYVTKINKSYIADKYFCSLDEEQSWETVSIGVFQTYKDIQYKFTKYLNNKVGDLLEQKNSNR